MFRWFGVGLWRNLRGAIWSQQVLNTVEDFLARPTTHQARTQFQLILRDTEGRLAVRTLGR
jgi:hypothetical protein